MRQFLIMAGLAVALRRCRLFFPLIVGVTAMNGQVTCNAGLDDVWKFGNTIDPITNEGKVDACENTKAINGGTRFTLVASCGFAPGSGALTLKIIPPDQQQLRSVSRLGDVIIRFSIDGRPSQTSGRLDFPSGAAFNFVSASYLQSEHLATFGSSDSIFAAHVMRIEVPLADGELPYFEIYPVRSPDFQKLASICKGVDNPSATRPLFGSAPNVGINPGEFAAKFTEALKRRAPLFGANASSYAPAVRELSDLVQLCTNVTPQEYAGAFARNSHGSALYPNLKTLENGKYAQCEKTTFEQVADSPVGERTLVFKSDLRLNWNDARQNWLGSKFHLETYFTLLRLSPEKKLIPVGDPPISIMDGSFAKKYIIFSVDIRPSDTGTSGHPTATLPAAPQAPAVPNTGTRRGQAVLTVVGGFKKPLIWGHYWLLKDDPSTALSKAGIQVPNGKNPDTFMRETCEKDPMICRRITQALDADGVAKIQAAGAGMATFPGVPTGSYYLMVSAAARDHHYLSHQRVELKPGANSLALTNASP